MTKILLTGHGGVVNRGCEAILRCTVSMLLETMDNPEFTLLSRYCEHDRELISNDFSNIEIYPSRPKGRTRLAPRRIANAIAKRLFLRDGLFDLTNKRAFVGQDIVIHIGGDNFVGGNISHWLKEFEFARSQNSMTVIWGASIGPFTAETEKKYSSELKKVDLITAREDLTVEFLKSIDVVDNVVRVCDPAFLLEAAVESEDDLVLQDRDMVVGLGLSDLVSRGGCGQRMYLASFEQFARHLLNHYNATLVFVPHVIERTAGHNDLRVCEEIAENLKAKDRVFIVDKNANAMQMKRAIGKCDYFIGARTHSTIASLSSMVPTLSIAYSRKAYGLNLDVFDHTKYVIPSEKICFKTLKSAFERLVFDKDRIVHELSSKQGEWEKMAKSGACELASRFLDFSGVDSLV